MLQISAYDVSDAIDRVERRAVGRCVCDGCGMVEIPWFGVGDGWMVGGRKLTSERELRMAAALLNVGGFGQFRGRALAEAGLTR